MAERDRLIDRSKTLRRLIGLFDHNEKSNDITPHDLGEIDGEAFRLACALPHQDFEKVKYWGEATVPVPEILTTAILIEGGISASVKFTVLIRRQRVNPKTRILAEIDGWRVTFDVVREKDVRAVVSGGIMPRSRFNYVLNGRDALPIFEGLVALGKEVIAKAEEN